MRPDSARSRARVRTAAAIVAASALAVGGALVATPGHAQPLIVEDALFDWQVNAESGGAAPLAGTCHFLVAGEVGDTGGTSGYNQSFYSAQDGATTIVKPDANGDDQVATWDDRCLDPNGNRTTTSASSTSGNRVQISGGTGTVDLATDTGTIQWEGSWTFVYYSGMTYWTVNDPRLEVEDGKGRIVGTFTGYGASMEDLGKWEKLPAQEGTVADFLDATVDLTEDGFTVTPDYLGVEVDAEESGFTQSRTGDAWGSFPQDWVDYNVRTGQSAYWFSSGGMFDPKKPTKPITVSYTTQETDLAQPAGVAVDEITTSTAQVTWQDVDGAEGYEVEYAVDGGDWQSADVSGTTAALADLSADASYRVRVRAVAGETVSPWAIRTFRTASVPRPTTSHEVTGATSADGLSVRVSGTDYVQDRIPANSNGIASGRMTSIGTGLIPHSTPDDQVSSSTVLGYGAALLGFLPGGALTANLNVQTADLDPKTDYDVVVWNATQGGNAGSGAKIYRAAVELTDEQKDDLFDGAATAVPAIDDLATPRLGDTFLTLQWSSDASYTTNVRWRKASDEEFAPRDSRTTSGWGSSMSITGLERGTEYVFETERSRNGVWSETRQYRFTTLESVPQAGKPEPVAETVTDTTIALSWEAAENAVEYNVSWKAQGSSTTRSNTTKGATSYTVSGLAPDTEYVVTVRGVTDLGVESEPGGITVRTTPEGGLPTEEPSVEPTEGPTVEPTTDPTAEPTVEPTEDPTVEPTEDPTEEPTVDPTEEPTVEPTDAPTSDPSEDPTDDPTDEPTGQPTDDPSENPSEVPSDEPTEGPTVDPTDVPTAEPTDDATDDATDDPSDEPGDDDNGSDEGTGDENGSGDGDGSGSDDNPGTGGDNGSGGTGSDDSDAGNTGSGGGSQLPRTGSTLTALFAGIGAILVGVGAVAVARCRG